MVRYAVTRAFRNAHRSQGSQCLKSVIEGDMRSRRRVVMFAIVIAALAGATVYAIFRMFVAIGSCWACG